MYTKHRIVKGDLVRIKTGTRLDGAMRKAQIAFVATVLECRYKSDAYLILPANSPFTTQPYWSAGSSLEVLEK